MKNEQFFNVYAKTLPNGVECFEARYKELRGKVGSYKRKKGILVGRFGGAEEAAQVRGFFSSIFCFTLTLIQKFLKCEMYKSLVRV